MNADLQQFVREALARGIPRSTIRERLAEAGWRPEEIDAALTAWSETDFPIPVPRRRAYLSAREAFLYLVLFVTLYITAFNVGALLFQFIERWLPDPATSTSSGDRFAVVAVRDALGRLIIAYPVFLYLSAFIGRLTTRDPEKRASKVRKWLTYITLLVAAVVILGDLMFLVARLLSGELPPRFLAKTFVVFAIAGFVFGHYLADLRREEDQGGPARRAPGLLARVAGVAVVAVLGTGLFVAGSPRHARLLVIDERRLEELMQASNGVETYYRDHQALPAALDSLLRMPNIDVRSIQDPVTRRPYEYRVVNDTTYELCATFDEPDTLGDGRGGWPAQGSHFWRHPAGHTCFRLPIPRNVMIVKRP